MHDQWLYAALAGGGVGLLLAPASADAANRAMDASYGEVTGITQTVRNFAASLGLAVFGTILTHVTTDRVTETLTGKGVPEGPARDAARSVAESVTGNPDAQQPSGAGAVARTMRDSMDAIRTDFAQANQWVFYGMAISLVLAFLCSFLHPGTRVTGADDAAPGAGPVPDPTPWQGPQGPAPSDPGPQQLGSGPGTADGARTVTDGPTPG